MREQQLSPSLQKRLENRLKLALFYHALVETLDLKITKLLDSVVPMALEGKIPQQEVIDLVAFDQVVQTLIWSEYERYGSMKILANTIRTDHQAGLLLSSMKEAMDKMTAVIQRKMFELEEIQKRLRVQYQVN